MTDAAQAMARIEAIVAEIERLDAASGGKFRQSEDREAHDIAARIERKMSQQIKPGEMECLEANGPMSEQKR